MQRRGFLLTDSCCAGNANSEINKNIYTTIQKKYMKQAYYLCTPKTKIMKNVLTTNFLGNKRKKTVHCYFTNVPSLLYIHQIVLEKETFKKFVYVKKKNTEEKYN